MFANWMDRESRELGKREEEEFWQHGNKSQQSYLAEDAIMNENTGWCVTQIMHLLENIIKSSNIMWDIDYMTAGNDVFLFK